MSPLVPPLVVPPVLPLAAPLVVPLVVPPPVVALIESASLRPKSLARGLARASKMWPPVGAGDEGGLERA